MTNESEKPSSRWLLVYAFGLVFIQGLMVNHASVLMPVLEEAYQLDKKALGQTASLALSSGFLALFLSGYVTEWLRPKSSGILAVVLMGAGCAVMGIAPSLAIVIVGLMILQFGISWMLAVHSAVITEHFPHSRQRLFLFAMAILSLGAIIGPPATGKAIETFMEADSIAAWQKAYLCLGGLLGSLLALLLIICGRRIAPLAARRLVSSGGESSVAPKRESESESESGIANRRPQFLLGGVFNRPALYLIGLIVLFDNLATINILTWLGVMATDRFGATPSDVGYLSSVMAVGVLVGRICMASFLSGRISDRKLLGYSYAVAMLVFMLMLAAPSMAVLYVLYFLMSFFVSVQSATTYAIGAEKFGDRAAVGIPVADGVGSLGAIAAPWILGSLASQVGLDRALWLIPLFGLMLSIISLGWEWFDKRAGRNQAN